MTEKDFVYWLQGFFEIQDASNQTNSGELNNKQVKIIRDHLALVFNKVTPNYPLDIVTWPITYCYADGNRSVNTDAIHEMSNDKFPITC